MKSKSLLFYNEILTSHSILVVSVSFDTFEIIGSLNKKQTLQALKKQTGKMDYG